MTCSKLSFFSVIFMLITVGAFMAELEAEEVSNEQERAITQEFITAAQKFVEVGEIEKAIEIYERIVKGAPDDFESRVQLATLYSRINQHEKAAQTYSELLETDPENTKYQDALVNSLQAAGKHNEALEIAQAYIQTDPEVGVHYARLAKLYEAEGNEAAAIANSKKATVFEYGDKKIYLILAEHYFLNEDIAAAEKALTNAMTYTTSEWERNDIERQLVNLYRFHGNLAEMLQKAETEGTITYEMQKERARLLLTAGELEKSVDAFKKAHEMASDFYERNRVAEELLKVYLKQGRTDLALEFYKAEASKHPRLVTHTTLFVMSGITVNFRGDDERKTLINAYKDQGELEGLTTIFEGKLEKNANNPNVIEMLAEIYWNANDYQKAAETYRMLSKAEPKNIRSFYYAAAAFHKSNQPDLVKAVLNQANNRLASIKDMTLIGALATICLDNEMYDPAIKLTDVAVTKEKNRGNSWRLKFLYAILAKSYHGTKRYEEAYKAYQKLLEVDDGGYMQGRAETEMKKIAKEGKLYEKWIPEQLKKAAENLNDPEPILKVAESYEATNKFKEAIALYERLSQLEPDNSQWHKKLGDLYQNLPLERRETGTVSEKLSLEQLAKSISAYEIAVELKPTSYQLYDLLAKTYIKAVQPSQAEATYHRALDTPLKQSEHDSAIRALSALYADEGQENESIAFLEEIKPKMDNSAVLYELLGDLYNKIGDPEKAELANAKWLKIRQKEVNRQGAYYQRRFANQLLEKGLFPETALKLAKRAFHKNNSSDYDYPATLGHACVANGLYDEALKFYKYAFSVISNASSFGNFWGRITDAGKSVNDKGRYYKMLDTLANSIPPTYSGFRINVNRIIVKLGLAEYYSKNNMHDKAMEQMQQTGMIAENAWLTLGLFDNTGGVGFNTEYILEDTTQIDLTGQYEGVNEQISWKKLSDDTFNGFIDFGSDTNWSVSYAWVTVASPNERKVHFRFDSDDQGKIWLNGEEIFANTQDKSISLDRDIIPVTLKAGKNTILVKVCNEEKTCGFYLRVTDTDGKPYEDLHINEVSDTD